MIFMTVFCYLLAIGLLILSILYYTHIVKSLTDGDKYIFVSITFFAVAIYCTWALCSEYLKFYMFISNNKIEFYNKKASHKYDIADLNSFEIIKKANWLLGGYWVFKLIFNDCTYIIHSFKGQELKTTLEELL